MKNLIDTKKPITRKRVKQNKLKYRIILFLGAGLILLTVIIAIAFFLSTWFDIYKLVFQAPVNLSIRSPYIISKRLPISPIPKVTFIEVSPLTSPVDIDLAAKQGTVPQYADMGKLKPISREIIRDLIHNKVVQKWGESSWNEIDYIITHESNYNPYIVNKSSGACGIFQSLPCSKLPSLDITDQINWGMNYLQNRYGSAKNAYAFKLKNGWY